MRSKARVGGHRCAQSFGTTKSMSRTKNVILDTALILGGAGLSTLFVSTDGNGQNPLPVAAGMGLVVLIAGAVSFALGWLVRSLPLAIVGSAAITELAFLLGTSCAVLPMVSTSIPTQRRSCICCRLFLPSSLPRLFCSYPSRLAEWPAGFIRGGVPNHALQKSGEENCQIPDKKRCAE